MEETCSPSSEKSIPIQKKVEEKVRREKRWTSADATPARFERQGQITTVVGGTECARFKPLTEFQAGSSLSCP
jgi:pyruvate dehydrogenase complex dehydrogenase (E1) component